MSEPIDEIQPNQSQAAEKPVRETSSEPVMVVAFDGWNDAGDAASAAIEHLQLNWDATPLAELGPDDYYDFQVSRPSVRMVDGVTRHIEWPTTRLSVCRPEGSDRDIVLVQGPEPNMRWRAFCDELVEYMEQLNISTVVTLGALLTDTSHTRLVPVTGSAYDAEAATRYGLEHNQYEGTIGITGVLQNACVQVGIPAISIWAGVPHYVSHPPSPKATLALLNKLEDVLDIEIPLGALPEQAQEWELAVTEMAADDEEVLEYIKSLEERGDEDMKNTLNEASGEKIAAEFERYLRRRRPGRQ